MGEELEIMGPLLSSNDFHLQRRQEWKATEKKREVQRTRLLEASYSTQRWSSSPGPSHLMSLPGPVLNGCNSGLHGIIVQYQLSRQFWNASLIADARIVSRKEQLALTPDEACLGRGH